MKRLPNPLSTLAICAALIFTLGCRRHVPPLGASPASLADGGSPAARLDILIAEHIDAIGNESPLTSTWLGQHAHDDRLDDLSSEAQARRLARSKQALERLLAIPASALTPERAFDRALLERELRLAVFELTVERNLERNPMHYADLALGGLSDILSEEWVPLDERLRLINQRLRKMRAFFDEAKRNLKTPPELLVRRALELGQNLRGFVADTLPLIPAALGDERLTAEFNLAHGEAVHAIDDWLSWIQKDLMPRARGEAAIGRERLAEKLRIGESIEVPLETIQTIAEQELKKTRLAFEATAWQIAPGKSPADIIRLLEDDHGKAEHLLTAVTTSIDNAADLVRNHNLVSLADSKPKVVEMPPFLWGLAMVVLPGPLDHHHESWFLIEPIDHSWDKKWREEHLRAFARPFMLMTVMHEVIPGHFLQYEHMRKYSSPLGKVARSAAFVEGWAEYAKEMMLNEGFGEGDPRVRLALLRDQSLRLARLVAALRFHAQGAHLDDIGQIFKEDAYLEDYAAKREAERVACDPWSLLPGLGLLELRKLRDDFREEAGETFALFEFHNQLLAHGAPPIALLRKLLLKQAGDLL